MVENRNSVLFVTNRCNSNCLMCPDTEYQRRKPSPYSYEELLEQVRAFEPLTENIVITGGEPTLLKQRLPELVRECYRQAPDSRITVLTNGRAFADRKYASLWDGLGNDLLLFEIPIHGFDEQTHDRITQSPGSFGQTAAGIHNLFELGLKVGARLVVSRLNEPFLERICQFLVTEYPKLSCVNIMGLEMLGNAYALRDRVWIDFDAAAPALARSVECCFYHGIQPQLYNFPLCLFEKKYWNFYRKSITPDKVRFFPECEECGLRSQCGGFFFSTILRTQFQVKPFHNVNEVSQC